MEDSAPPLILTLALDSAAQAFFNDLRQQHFPPARNYLAAHLTLFHHLPGGQAAAIGAQLQTLCAAQPPLALAVSGVRSLGRGVAYTLACPPLQALHRALQHEWAAHLTPQDRQPLRPHVTVQNKVLPAQAQALLAELAAGFVPFAVRGTGLQLWDYEGGPWAARATFSFTQAGQ